MPAISGPSITCSGRPPVAAHSAEATSMIETGRPEHTFTAEKPVPPRRLAVAPVKMIVPCPRGTMTRAASRPIRKPAKAAISQTLR